MCASFLRLRMHGTKRRKHCLYGIGVGHLPLEHFLPLAQKCLGSSVTVLRVHIALPNLVESYKGDFHEKQGSNIMKKPAQPEPIVIKKYANRRLYNTDTSSYVTLDDLCEMVKEGSEFIVYDAKSGEDLTRQILTQIIFEQESRGQNLLPISFLRNIIGFYDNSLKDFVPAYLETAMQTFLKNQEKMREYVMGSKAASGAADPFGQVAHQLEEIGKQNMEFFTKAFSMFTPFSGQEPPKKK